MVALPVFVFTLTLHMLSFPKKRPEIKSLSRVQLFATPWTVAHQAPPSMEFSRQEYWSGLPFPSAGDLPDPGIKSGSPAFQADSLLSEPPGKPREETQDMLFPQVLELTLIRKRNHSSLHIIFTKFSPTEQSFLTLCYYIVLAGRK